MKEIKKCFRSFIVAIGWLAVILVTASRAHAQQREYTRPENQAELIARSGANTGYTYKIFQAPNKMYGFDILKNGKFVFHQPASNIVANSYRASLAKKEDAEKAALFSIEKIRKGEPAALLTQVEIKKIVAQKTPETITTNH